VFPSVSHRGQLQTPLTGIEIPSTDKIGVSEFFSNTTPAPGAMEAFTDPLSILSPEKLDNAKTRSSDSSL
jgi:hypothetical protein